MTRKIKPLEWREETDHQKIFSTVYVAYYGELKYAWIHQELWFPAGQSIFYVFGGQDVVFIAHTKTLPEAKAAVEQAFVKWLDTFSEEVGE